MSDEIWDDIILDENIQHIPFASLDHPAAKRAITFVAASKTWNIAGLGCAAAIIPEKRLRQQWRQAGSGLVPMVNPLGYAASEAAWRDGDPWRQRLIQVLRFNRECALATIEQILVSHVFHHRQPTFSGSIAESGCLLNRPAGSILNRHVKKQGLAHRMEMIWSPGFLRINCGCPPELLNEGLKRLHNAFHGIETFRSPER